MAVSCLSCWYRSWSSGCQLAGSCSRTAIIGKNRLEKEVMKRMF
ncbi:hypothetical protein CP10743SC13_2412, partial [Chlamydia psittaci 10_743_SC13]